MNEKSKKSKQITQHDEIALLQIVFVDIVRYSQRRTKTQQGVIKFFTSCLKNALTKASKRLMLRTQNSKKGDFPNDIISLPTGDGAAITFQVGEPRDIHLFFAKSLLEEIHLLQGNTKCPLYNKKRWCDCHPSLFEVRVGIGEGTCIIYEDINKNKNVAGEPINTAARVMGVADGWQIIFTKQAYKGIVNLFPYLEGQFAEYKNVKIKREIIDLYQYLDKQEGSYINNDPPEEMEDYEFVTKSVLQEVIEPIGIKLEQLASSSGCQFLDGSKAIYEAVTKAIKEAEENIRVVLLESRPEASKSVLKALADAVNKRGVRYDIVVVHNPDKPSAGFEKNHDDLMRLLTEVRGEEHDRYHPYVLETKKPICFDTIIVDAKAVGIGFTHTEGGSELQHSIMIRNEDMAGKFEKWFDNVVMNVVKVHGKKFNEWRKKKNQKKSGCGND